MPSKQNLKAIREWQQEKNDLIRFLVRKEKQFPARIQSAIDAGKAPSRQAYIIAAVDAALEHDGIPAPKTDEQPED